MANLVADSFDWFPTGLSDANRERLWGANEFFAHHDPDGMTPADVVTGRFSFGKAFALSGGLRGATYQEAGYVVPVGATPGTGFLGCGVYVDSALAASTRPMLGFYDAVTNAFQCSITFEANGVVRVWQGSKSAALPLAASVAGSFQEDQWFHCEIKPLIANSGGTVEVRINTVPKVQLVGADTQTTANAYFDSVFLGGHASAAFVNVPGNHPIVFDDMFVNDTTGAQNNNWSGNLRAYGMLMTANGYLNNFAIGGSSPAATHWQSVLNQNLDDTKFEYSPNVGDIDAFTPDPVVNGPLVRVLQMRAALRQDDATQRVGRLGIRIGSTNYFGTVDQYTNQTFTFYKDRFELSPATSVTLTGSEVNGCQALVKVQA